MKIPEARRLESGSWFIQLRLGGESISITEDTKARCELVATQIKTEHKLGLRKKKIPAADKTISELVDKFIEERSGVLSPSTLRGYKTIRDTRFQRYMKTKVSNINWQKAIDEEARLCSPKTLKNAWGLMSSAMRAAELPVPSVRLPQVPPKEMPYLDADQIKIFLSAIKGKPGELAALLALHSLRRSELCALTWENVDLKNRQILVSGAMVPGPDQKFVVKAANKNVSSHRYVPILINRLYELLSEREEESGVVVTGTPNLHIKQINRVCEKAGLPLVGVHGLRRSFASLGYSLGLPERAVMEIGGWADYQTMHKVYIKLSRKDMEKWTEAMSSFYNS